MVDGGGTVGPVALAPGRAWPCAGSCCCSWHPISTGNGVQHCGTCKWSRATGDRCRVVRFERLVVALLVRGDMLGSFAAGVEAGGRSSQLVEWSRRRVGEAELPSYFVRVVSLLFAPLSLVLRRLSSSIYGGMRPTAIGVAESHAPIEGMPLLEGCPYWRDASSIYLWRDAAGSHWGCRERAMPLLEGCFVCV